MTFDEAIEVAAKQAGGFSALAEATGINTKRLRRMRAVGNETGRPIPQPTLWEAQRIAAIGGLDLLALTPTPGSPE